MSLLVFQLPSPSTILQFLKDGLNRYSETMFLNIFLVFPYRLLLNGIFEEVLNIHRIHSYNLHGKMKLEEQEMSTDIAF